MSDLQHRRSPRVETCRVRCGCVIGKFDVGEGWSVFRIHRCRRHRRVPRSFLKAPCGCVVWRDGVHERCPKHSFLSPIQPAPGVQ